MLSVLLTILKIIGIVLLVIVALVLLAVLLVLFVPIRYRLEAEGRVPEVQASVRVTWLLHLLSVFADFDRENKLRYGAKLFGKTVFPRTKKKKAKKPKAEKTAAPEPAREEERPLPEKAEEVSVPELPEEPVVPALTEAPSLQAPELETIYADRRPLSEKELKAREKAEKKEEKKRRKAQAAETGEKASGGKARALFEKLRGKAEQIAGKIEAAKEKAEKGIDFVESEENQRAFSLIRDKLFYVLRHIRPRTLTGRLVLGLKDPSLTGKITGFYYAALWHRLYRNFSFTPVFDEEIIEGDLFAKGHIRLIHPALAALSLYRNKTIRSWIKH